MRTTDDFETYCQANASDSKPILLTDLLSFFGLKEGDYLVMPRANKMARVYLRVSGQPVVATIDEHANVLPLCDYSRRPPAYLYLHTLTAEEKEDTLDVLEHKSELSPEHKQKLALARKILV